MKKKKNFFKKHPFWSVSSICITIVVGLLMFYPTIERPMWVVYVILITILVLLINIICALLTKMSSDNGNNTNDGFVFDNWEEGQIH